MRGNASDPSPHFGRRGPGAIGRGVGGAYAIGVAERWPSPGHSELGANKNHLEAAQVHGTVVRSWGLETVGLEEVRLDTFDRAETRNSFWRPRIQT
jgi:hypothetical protein